jgi:predicted lipoprotein
MQTEVLVLLATFLDAIPAQVKIWDRKVIEYLSSNARALQEFKAASKLAKWDIYTSIRYRRPG